MGLFSFLFSSKSNQTQGQFTEISSYFRRQKTA